LLIGGSKFLAFGLIGAQFSAQSVYFDDIEFKLVHFAHAQHVDGTRFLKLQKKSGFNESNLNRQKKLVLSGTAKPAKRKSFIQNKTSKKK